MSIIVTNETGTIIEANAPSFALRTAEPTHSKLIVRGVPDSATVQLLVNNSASGTFVPSLDPYGVAIGTFVNTTGYMAVKASPSMYGKIVISGGGGSQSLTVEYN